MGIRESNPLVPLTFYIVYIMIIFDQLRISDDGKRMFISIHVNGADAFKNYYLKDLTIMTSDKVSETAPEGVIIDTETTNAEAKLPTDCIFYKNFEEGLKSVDLVIDNATLSSAYLGLDEDTFSTIPFDGNFSNKLFFVYVRWYNTGTTDPCIPCDFHRESYLGVTFDENLLYQKVMGYTKDLLKECTIPAGFTDFILLWNAFKASVETEHYIPAIKYYNMLFGYDSDGNAYGPYGGTSTTITRNCGCNG